MIISSAKTGIQSLALACFIIFGCYANDTPPGISSKIVNLKLSDNAGIGNRLKKIISYLRYYHPKHLNLYWSTASWVTTPFSDLFVPEWKTSITEFNAPYLIENFKYKEPLQPWVNEFSLLVAADEFKDGKHRTIDVAYHDIPPHIIKRYLPYFQALKPSEVVAKRINEVHLPENAVAVQIRNAPDWQYYFQITEPEQTFFAIMDKFPADTIFYLSAMSKESAAPFYKRYPNRIIELPNKDYHSMIDAVADMYILGSTKEAVYQYNSTFSEVGWWLGGAKTKVHIAGNTVHHVSPPPTLKILDKFPKN